MDASVFVKVLGMPISRITLVLHFFFSMLNCLHFELRYDVWLGLFLDDSSCCSESQREAALLLGQFAATDSDCKVVYHFFFILCSCVH